MAIQTQTYSPRITGADFSGAGKPILLVRYKVEPNKIIDGKKYDYGISLDGGQDPLTQTNWMRQNGTITHEMLNLLVPQDAVNPLRADNTYVWTNSNPEYFEGLRALIWDFRLRVRPDLGSDWGPWNRFSNRGSLLGSVAEGEGRLKIGGVDYFVQPEVARRGEDLWETQLYVQEKGLVNSSAQNVNRIVAFVQTESPNKQWLRSEVERFEKREGLKERQVRDAYRQLRDGIWKSYWVRSSEILAWPLMLSEEAENFVNVRVPHAQYGRLKELAKEAGIPLSEI